MVALFKIRDIPSDHGALGFVEAAIERESLTRQMLARIVHVAVDYKPSIYFFEINSYLSDKVM